MKAIRARAAMLARCREFFRSRAVLEVETPVLSQAGNPDPNIASFRLRTESPHEILLNTSPEFAMKRLLAAGSGDIFQIAKAFRDDEAGTLHSREFTMLEWYRQGFTLEQLMQEVAALLALLFARAGLEKSAIYLSYRQAFAQHAGFDPVSDSEGALLKCLRASGVEPPTGHCSRDLLLDLVMTSVVLPKLDPTTLVFIYDFPVSQAALARAHPENPLLARRFEAVFGGVELANGFEELLDPVEQRARFAEDVRRREQSGAPPVPVDENLLAALEAGLADCAGVAVGLDRVLMFALGVRHIDEVLCFPAERA